AKQLNTQEINYHYTIKLNSIHGLLQKDFLNADDFGAFEAHFVPIFNYFGKAEILSITLSSGPLC
uniref:hypothetical protein n=1 Tax=Bartonella sp. CL43QHWL TaxID=3243532 RepID=UPI0035D07C69